MLLKVAGCGGTVRERTLWERLLPRGRGGWVWEGLRKCERCQNGRAQEDCTKVMLPKAVVLGKTAKGEHCQ